MAHYRALRLERARALLRQTRMQVVEVALACGLFQREPVLTRLQGPFRPRPGGLAQISL